MCRWLCVCRGPQIRCRCLSQDEYNTSQFCSSCDHRLAAVPGHSRDKRCTNPFCHVDIVDRDNNASKNQLKVYNQWVLDGTRPPHLRRPEKGHKNGAESVPADGETDSDHTPKGSTAPRQTPKKSLTRKRGRAGGCGGVGVGVRVRVCVGGGGEGESEGYAWVGGVARGGVCVCGCAPFVRVMH